MLQAHHSTGMEDICVKYTSLFHLNCMSWWLWADRFGWVGLAVGFECWGWIKVGEWGITQVLWVETFFGWIDGSVVCCGCE